MVVRTRRQVLACVSAASFHLPVGLVVAYSAILLDQLQVTPDPQIRIDENQASWIGKFLHTLFKLRTRYLKKKIYNRFNSYKVAPRTQSQFVIPVHSEIVIIITRVSISS